MRRPCGPPDGDRVRGFPRPPWRRSARTWPGGLNATLRGRSNIVFFICPTWLLAGMEQPVLKVNLEQSESYLLAQCIANPSIIVSGKNRTAIRDKLASGIAGYVEAFPKSKRRFFVGDKMKKVVFVDS